MSKPKWLGKNDQIVAAYAERAAGPGWANRLIWCVVQDGDKKVRLEALQPEDWTPDIFLLFPIAATLQTQLMTAVDRALPKRRARGRGRSKGYQRALRAAYGSE